MTWELKYDPSKRYPVMICCDELGYSPSFTTAESALEHFIEYLNRIKLVKEKP